MSRFKSLYSNSVGKKFIAAFTGVILLGFLLGHMAGNLKVFTGSSPEGVPHIDEYGQFLKDFGKPVLPAMVGLWVARIVLLLSLVLHVWSVSQLAIQNARARPVKYVRTRKRAASFAALWMMFSGIVILAFVIFHILHFTTGTIRLGDFEHGYVYNNLHSSFGKWYVSFGYAAVMVVIGVHLFHGVWSLFQTLGLDNPDRNRMLRTVAVVLTIVITAGFAVVPMAFLTGAMPPGVDYVHSLLTNH